jgi:rRNA maturation protein Nop10
MGRRFITTCKACGYQTETSLGRDRGFVAIIEPMICADEKEVVQVTVGIDKESPKYQTLTKGGLNLEKDLNLCPKCHGQNLKPWNKTCPKCGQEMEIGDLSGLWD